MEGRLAVAGPAKPTDEEGLRRCLEQLVPALCPGGPGYPRSGCADKSLGESAEKKVPEHKLAKMVRAAEGLRQLVP
jgi:hypothetical protein